MLPTPGDSRSTRKQRRQAKKRARELRRAVQAAVFMLLQLTGFGLANFAARDSWAELSGFLLLQPAQIVLNLLDTRFQLTRGLRDPDAVLLVSLVSLPLNVLFWYSARRGWRKLRRARRRRRDAAGSPYGAAHRSVSTRPAVPLSTVSNTALHKSQPGVDSALRK